jgi:hypothetical protein
VAAVPINIVGTSVMSSIYLIKDEEQVLCKVRSGQARRSLIPLSLCFGESTDPDSDNSDADEEQTYLEECAGLLYDLNLADDEDTLQSH